MDKTFETKLVRLYMQKFAFDLFNKVQSGKNTFISPFSIQVALGMLLAGAKEETKNILADLLCVPRNQESSQSLFETLVKEVSAPKKDYKFSTANALWAAGDLAFEEEYKTVLKDKYEADFTTIDYKAKEVAVKTINDWVDVKTEGKIKELITPDFINDATRLILTNALYFKGSWKEPFEKNKTKKEKWNNTEHQVDMMYSGEERPYYETDDFQAIELDYVGRALSMLVILPREEKSITLSPLLYEEINANLQYSDGNLRFPKFKADTGCQLADVLKEMGAGVIFSDHADFSGISNEQLKVSEVIHKVFVAWDEVETEAAAATAVGIMKCAGMPKNFFDFHANRPFYAIIRHKYSNVIYFMGKVEKP